ncbi:hypothetical protein [Halarchaeum sp. CBA1220]|uniref:hypothetical protein n=1 Tax=Halarchaeum sp. CBA1220 TaxID=1853682 RepID=UPI0021064A38|nr:hypothetical protein [Halarchaeum sp. CBA1220]
MMPVDAGSSTSDTVTPVGWREHYTCAAASLAATVVAVALLYPALVALTRPLGVFSTTALVLGVAAVMGVAWLTLELVWEWCAGRLGGS